MSKNEYNYALAYFHLGEEENKLDAYFNDLKSINKILLENNDLVNILDCYTIDEKEKNILIDKCFNYLNEDYSRDFLKLIVSKHLIKRFSNIFESFHQIYNDKMQIQSGIIYSTIKLSQEQIKELELAFLKKKKQKVELENIIDKNLIGGIKVVIKDQIFDGSIKNQLESLKNAIKKEGD